MTDLNRQFNVGFSRAIASQLDAYTDFHGFAIPCSIDAIGGVRNPTKNQKLNTSIVTVKFEIENNDFPLTDMPVLLNEYLRYPIHTGMTGIALKTPFYLGGIADNGGVARLSAIGNLSGMFFIPLGSTKFGDAYWDMITTKEPICDNAHNFTPTRLFDKSKLIIERIEELADILTLIVQKVNALPPVTQIPIPSTIKKLINAIDNLTEDNP